jgi:tetratricopeptide (TPR) repeat protein
MRTKAMFKRIKALFESKNRSAEKGSLELREGSPELHYLMAKSELDTGDNLAHGFLHLAELLAFDPTREEWLGLVEEYINRAKPKPMSLLKDPEDGKSYFATEAMRSWLLAKESRTNEAIDLLNQVAAAKRDVPYLETWGVRWLRDMPLNSIDDMVLLQLFAIVLNRHPEYKYATSKTARLIRPVAQLGLGAKHLHHEDKALMTLAGICRKAGMFEEGLALIHDRGSKPNWYTAVAQGLLLREKGALDDAESCFQSACELDSNDMTAMLEAGDMFFDAEDWARALAWYERALIHDAHHEWAQPSAIYCRWLDSGDFNDLPQELIDMASQGNSRADMLLDRFREYEGYLPEPPDATANVLRQMLREFDEKNPSPEEPADGKLPTGNITIGLSDVEAPSNAVAICMAFASRFIDATPDLSYDHIAQPDPRELVCQVDFHLWKRAGEILVPALAPASANVQEQVAGIASSEYNPRRWLALSSHVAEDFNTAKLTEILACICNPPSAPRELSVFEWIPRVQLVCCQILGQLPEETAWEDSMRRKALYAVLWGPRDWSTAAAAMALSQLAIHEPLIALDVDMAFKKLESARPDSGYLCYEHGLYYHWTRLPHLFDHERESLYKKLKETEEESQ